MAKRMQGEPHPSLAAPEDYPLASFSRAHGGYPRLAVRRR